MSDVRTVKTCVGDVELGRILDQTILAEHLDIRRWAEQQIERTTGDGSYAKGQRVVLRRLIEFLETKQ